MTSGYKHKAESHISRSFFLSLSPIPLSLSFSVSLSVFLYLFLSLTHTHSGKMAPHSRKILVSIPALERRSGLWRAFCVESTRHNAHETTPILCKERRHEKHAKRHRSPAHVSGQDMGEHLATDVTARCSLEERQQNKTKATRLSGGDPGMRVCVFCPL